MKLYSQETAADIQEIDTYTAAMTSHMPAMKSNNREIDFYIKAINNDSEVIAIDIKEIVSNS